MKPFIRGFAATLFVFVLAVAAPNPQATMRAQNVPGLELVVVVDRGRIVTDAAYGVRNLDTQQPVDIHTRFEIGSITKQFTAAAILQLKEEGKLSLDDRLGTYVPQYREGRAITLRQLLLQISGVPNYTETKAFGALIGFHGSTLRFMRTGTFDAILAMLRGKKLDFAPGTRWEYSNSNYVLLGRVVEIASGMPWREYIRTHIFAQAGMTDSAFMRDEPSIADMATGYRVYHGALRPAGSFNGWARGAGAIVSTATDLAKWDAALFGGKIVSLADVRLMTSPGTLPAGGPNARYGFGWVVDRYDGQPRLWHNGGTLGFQGSNQIYPRLGERIIVLVNSTGGNSDAIADAMLEQLHPRFAALANAAVSGEDPAITARAKATLAQFLNGTVDRTQLSAGMNRAMTPDVIADAKVQFAALGTPTAWVFKGKRVAGGATTYEYHVTFSTGTQLNVYMSVDADGKISGYLLSPN